MQQRFSIGFWCYILAFSHVYAPMKASCESRLPKIGIFWFVPAKIDRQLICVAREIGRVQTVVGFKTIKEGHVDTWAKAQKVCRSLRPFGYEHFPRGRVNWREHDGAFLLLADPSIFDRNLHTAIIERWSLQQETVHLFRDSHYRTNQLPSIFSRGGRA
ncbi:hypothetical protein [Rhizobium phaseoli]|uniref:hypothetical protein n=1 Tax=Rhizobium phaseoli TaxID=396 RepID=UPI0007EB0ABC|nr:hypothetical protein [Rhizobium phaseoli]